MKRSEFFAVAKITRAPIFVEQTENGYQVSMKVQHEGEEEQNFAYDGMLYRSFDNLVNLLRENGIFKFNVTIGKEELPTLQRNKTEEEVKTTEK